MILITNTVAMLYNKTLEVCGVQLLPEKLNSIKGGRKNVIVITNTGIKKKMCRFSRICLYKEALTLAALELGFFPPRSLQKESSVLSL